MRAPAEAYRPHETYVAPARPHSELWRFLLGGILAGFAYLSLSQIYFSTAYALAQPNSAALHRDLVSGATPLTMFLLLFSFGFMAVGVGISARILHKRSFLSLLGPMRVFWRDLRRVLFALLGVALAIVLLPPYDMGGAFVPNLEPRLWLSLLPLSLIAVFVQVSAEEIVFRGYVQQQLAARFKSPLIWMVLPAFLFALGHYLPDMAGENALTIAIWAGIFGILMADLTARSGSLGPAIAVHFFNNVSAILIVALPDNLSGLSLYLAPFSMAEGEALQAWLPVDFATMFVCWLAARVAIRR
ncbi:MAG: CPBP family intramembrane metalloprotease [Sulfitobacter sp.]|nr:CPBP family intramembrane metalloprotease [Sulfitobacter sp.]